MPNGYERLAMTQTVAEILVEALQEIGVKQVFGLIGDSLNPFGDAIRNSSIEWIGVRHEEGAALAAAGQAKLTGKLGVCAGTTGPGSTHLVSGLYEASRDHAPVLAISGDMPRKLQGTDHIQTTKPDLLFEDVSLFTETITTADNAHRIIHQAIAAAYAGRGVAHLTIPQDVFSTKTAAKVKSIATLKPRCEIAALPEDMEPIVKKINDAKKLVIMCGAGCAGLAEPLRALSDLLKAPLIHSVKGKDIMDYSAPCWMGGIGMIGTKAVYNAVMQCDLLLMLGTDYPYSEYLPENGTVIQIDERAKVLGRRTATALSLVSSAGPAVAMLLEKLKPKSDTTFFEKVTAQRKQWDQMLDKQADLARSKDKIHPQAVARMVSDLAKPDAVFTIDTGLNTLWSANWIRQTGKQRIIGSFNNAAVGTALAQANGIQAVDRQRQVIALTGDGGFNMLMGEFLTAVQHKLPVKIIIYNNSAFGLITLEAEGAGIKPFTEAIRFTNPDFAALAKACGGEGFTARQPHELHDAISAALACPGPAIVDATVVAYEIPNLPHLDVATLENVALAKIKEAVHFVMGS
jgi:pyruvate dehydrogenase (quinone)